MRSILLPLIGLFAGVSSGAFAAALDPASVDEFVRYMVDKHQFERRELESLFARARRSQQILDLISRPAEKVKPWHEYRSIFVNDKRIREGVAFWGAHGDALEQARARYGIPPEIIVAIIGVETAYGRIAGSHRVLDALATLAFHYPGEHPGRAAYFRVQLEHFLLSAREEGVDPEGLEGSYAGAMGIPQFMPENYRKLAVDFDGDGTRDIWRSFADAIGSVGNYLAHFGWRPDGPVMSRAVVTERPVAFLRQSIAPQFRLGELVAAGITPETPGASPEEAAAVFELHGASGPEYWIGYTNFYVISRYNPRVKYAMAVAQLARAVREARIAREQ